MKKRINQIDYFRNNPIEIQNKVFLDLIKRGKHTLYGKDFSFNNISSYSDFSKLVPISSYEELFPYIDKSRIGYQNVLWPGSVRWYAKSSGTTNDRSKYIPITKESLYDCHYKAGKDMMSLYCNNYPETNLYNGKGLMLGGTQENNKYYNFTEGDLSAILINNFPFWVNIHRTPDLQTALLSDWEQKLEAICQQSVKENVTNITGVPSWVLILLERILEKNKCDNLLEIWPNLELYMHGGVHFEPYVDHFKQIIPTEKMNYLEGYNASEGFFGIQDQKDSKDLLLMLDYGVFYEFIPLKDYNNGKIEAIPLEDVSIDEIYVLVISTNGGLWRYIIGDTIRFTCLDPFRIKIVGRTKSFINAFGEELMVDNAEKALKITCENHRCSIENYVVAPRFMSAGSGFHQWIIEFKTSPNSLMEFKKELDSQIRNLNADYDAKRDNNFVLRELDIIVAKKDLFYLWLKQNKRLGGQYKVPRLHNEPEMFDEILNLNEV